MPKIEKIKCLTLRELVDAYADNLEELRTLFVRLTGLVQRDPDICSKAEWRMLIGLHSDVTVPAASDDPLNLPGYGHDIAGYMKNVNDAYSDESGRKIFATVEIEEMVWASIGKTPPGEGDGR